MKLRTSRHHRLCRSLGGSDDPRNVVTVCHKSHSLWHIIFGNMHAHQIADEIERHFIDREIKLTRIQQVRKPIILGSNEASSLNMRKQAWNRLFHRMDHEMTLAWINSVWLDPDFILTTPKSSKFRWDDN